MSKKILIIVFVIVIPILGGIILSSFNNEGSENIQDNSELVEDSTLEDLEIELSGRDLTGAILSIKSETDGYTVSVFLEEYRIPVDVILSIPNLGILSDFDFEINKGDRIRFSGDAYLLGNTITISADSAENL